MDLNPPLLCVRDLRFAYPGRAAVLDELNFELPQGGRYGLVGTNGSGKTTLFHLLMGLLRPSQGQLFFCGEPVASRRDFEAMRRQVGLVFQDADDQLFCPSVLEDVAFGPLNQGKSRQEALDIARATLGRLGLENYEDRVPHRLSGGEKKLVSLATVLSMNPRLLLLDEPTAGLDPRTKDRLKAILGELDLALLLISHEMDFLRPLTSEVLVLDAGRIRTGEVEVPHTHLHVHRLGARPHGHD